MLSIGSSYKVPPDMGDSWQQYATRTIPLLYLRPTYGFLCRHRTQRSWREVVPRSPSYYLAIGNCCGSHQGHSVLSTTAFAVPIELILGNWLFLCPHDLLRGVALFTVASLEGCSSPAEFWLQGLTQHSHNFSVLLPSKIACSAKFFQQRASEPAAGAFWPRPRLSLHLYPSPG